MNFEQVLLNNLVHNEDFTRKTLPFIKSDYFHDKSERVVFEIIDEYYTKFNSAPTKSSLLVELGNKDNLNEQDFGSARQVVEYMTKENVDSEEWLLQTTEKFCQEKALFNAVRKAIHIMDDPESSEGTGTLPQLFTDALSVGFDTNIGHEYLENFEERFENYRKKISKIPFAIELLNNITKGGLANKTLNIIMAGTNVGKSLIMCDWAASHLTMGYNVLYVTLEMSEEEVSRRIDGNLLDIALDDLETIDVSVLKKRADKVKAKAKSRLIVKEFPTASAHAGNIRHLLNELRIKKNFKPDIIYVDYLNICASSRFKNLSSVNSYTLVKSIAEELRGLAVEFGVPIVSATQTTRSGYASSDLELGDTSESFGLPATADLMLGVMETEELAELGQYLFKQLKNRYADKNKCKRFVVGVHKSKMRLYDVEQNAQEDLVDDSPVMDRGDIGRRTAEENGWRRPENAYPGTNKFTDFR
jgi:replicative DNA helicase